MEKKIINKQNIYKKIKDGEIIEIYFYVRIEKYEYGKDYVNDYDYYISIQHIKNNTYEQIQEEIEIKLDIIKFDEKYLLLKVILPDGYEDNTYTYTVYSVDKNNNTKTIYEYGELGLIKHKNNIYPEI